MKNTASFVLFALLCAGAGASSASVHIQCPVKDGKCVPPPAAPAPPAPPMPPAPPAPPPLPALPPMPELPAVPQEAHAACAAKAPGTRMTWVIKEDETMSGVCERQGGKMVFTMRGYYLE